MTERGLIHLYYGDGKGKTTAAMGLVLRAIHAGKRVVIVQFLKNSATGEIYFLEQLGAKVYRGKCGDKFLSGMTEEEKAVTKKMQTENLQAAVKEDADVLILDEVCAVWQKEMIDRELLRRAVLEKPVKQELVLTGRVPAEWMIGIADYCTEMKCQKHPFRKGIKARKGVEF